MVNHIVSREFKKNAIIRNMPFSRQSISSFTPKIVKFLVILDLDLSLT